MAAERRARARYRSESLNLAVSLLTAAGTAFALIELALLLATPSPAPGWLLALFPAVAAAYLVAGAVAWIRRPSNRTGALLCAGGGVWILAGLANTQVPALVAVGILFATVPLGLIVHLLLSFPSGRLRGGLATATVAAGYLTCTVLEAPSYLFGDAASPGPASFLRVADLPRLGELGETVQTAVGLIIMTLTSTILWRRWRAGSPSQRRVMAPLYLYGIVAVLYVPFSTYLFGDGDQLLRAATQLLGLAGIPLAFLIATLRGGFARTGEIEELGALLGERPGSRGEMAGALAETLGDPGLELVYWAAESDRYVSRDGTPRALPEPASGKGSCPVKLGDEPVAAILYDTDLIADPEMVEAAGQVLALALAHERLAAELRASHEDLRQSRTRLVEAGDTERRRFARDLHDGLQTRLVSLAMQADQLSLGAGQTAGGAERLRSGLDQAITELRNTVQGVMPATLTEQGLGAAAAELTEALPLPVAADIELDGPRIATSSESAGWFVISEAVANTLRHGEASRIDLRLYRRDSLLRIVIEDDGRGGAHANGGSGLRGMADRAAAVNGTLSVDSPPGQGTRVTAELPCD